jgi:small conductance mechanosensitive channel
LSIFGKKKLWGCLLGLALLCGPVAAQETVVDEDVTTTEQSVSVEPTARDDEIGQRILEILRATGWYKGIKVKVSDGIVFLDGETDSSDHRIWARDLAGKTQDVVAVVNRIQVNQDLQWSVAPALRELQDVSKRVLTTLPLLILALVILPFTWWLSGLAARVLRRWLLRGIESPFLKDIVSRALALPIFLLGLYVVLQVAGLTQLAFSVVGGAGVLGIIVGFAFRDIAENFLASLLLSIRRPFRTGDFISVAGQDGSVRSMNTRSTVLLSPEGNHIQIPNSTIFKSTIVNFTASPTRRDTIEVGIGYEGSVAQAQEIVLAVLEAHEAVMSEPAPMVLVDQLASSTVNIKAYFWVNAHDFSMLKVKSVILRLVKKELTEAGISMPDDAREVIFPHGVPIVQLEGATEKRAREMAEVEIAESSLAIEPEQTEVASEADLANEQDEVEQLADAVDAPEGGTDLLSEKS